MTRALKFRVWDIRNKEMRAIDLYWFEEEGIRAVPDDTHGVYEIMQFTGLLDRNGKEVYEGDIVKGCMAHTDHIEVVYYEDAGLLSPFYLSVGYTGEIWASELVDGFEVIGNIHEHPELLPKRGAS